MGVLIHTPPEDTAAKCCFHCFFASSQAEVLRSNWRRNLNCLKAPRVRIMGMATERKWMGPTAAPQSTFTGSELTTRTNLSRLIMGTAEYMTPTATATSTHT